MSKFPAEANIPTTIRVYPGSDIVDKVKADSYLGMKPVKEKEGGWSTQIEGSIDYALMLRMGELGVIRDRYLNYEWQALKIPGVLEKIKATKEMWLQVAPSITEEYVSTYLSREDTAIFMRIKEKTTKMFESFDPEKEGKKKSGEISKLIATNVTNVTNDMDYLYNLRLELKRWANGQKALDPYTMQPGEETGMYCRSVGGSKTWATKKPYHHLMRKKEFQENPMMVQAKRDFEKLALYGYMKKNMPKTLQNFQDFFSAKQCVFVTEDNFILSDIVWDSTMKKAEGILASMSVNDPQFMAKIKEIKLLIYNTVHIPQRYDADEYYSVSGKLAPLPSGMDLDAIAGHSSVAKRYREFRQKLGELMEAYAKRIHEGPSEEEREAAQRSRQYNESYQNTKKRFEQLSNPHPDTTPSRNYQSMKELYDSFMTMKKTYDADTKAQIPDLTKNIGDLAKAMAAKLEEFRAAAASYEAKTGKGEAQIREFYNTFKKNYEDKRENRLIAVLDDRWQAEDGSTLEDVEDHFRNMFTVYNVIRYEFSGMRVEPHRTKENEYWVSYTLVIKGENYDMGIKREEKSDVRELVRIDSSGKIKVIQTVDGRFYYIN
ncbi:hypothetical protein LJC24_04095 [Desulfococcaceae bacterium OttesenSCG-928-F15]|nr:hypothetical protein [Desulfococcaceae bacterium OttesenSCG-928-F15]